MTEKFLEVDKLEKYSHSSIEYHVYYHYLADKAQWDKKDQVALDINNIKLFCNTKYCIFLKDKILTIFDENIKRLKDDGGITKASQLEHAKSEILELIGKKISTVGSIDTQNIQTTKQFMSELLVEVSSKVNELSQKDEINEQRNEIRAVLKGIAGVILTVAGLFIPLIFREFRQTFFATSTKKALGDIESNMQIDIDETFLNINNAAQMLL